MNSDFKYGKWPVRPEPSPTEPCPTDPVPIQYLSIRGPQRFDTRKYLVALPKPRCFEKEMGITDYIAVIPGLGEDTAVNRSIYMWDMGLWTACRESRQIIMKQSGTRGWRIRAEPLKRKKRYAYPWSSRAEDIRGLRLLLNGIVTGGSPSSAGRTEVYQLVFRPADDIICFDIQNILSILEPSEWRFGLDLIFPAIPFCPQEFQSSCIVEFTPDWNIGLPSDWHDLINEHSPRGFIARLVNMADKWNFNGFIWLLDRGCSPEQGPTDPGNRVKREPWTKFYDCADEYSEVDFRADTSDQNSAKYIFPISLGAYQRGI